MNVDLTDAQKEFRVTVRKWLAENLPQELAHKVRSGLNLTEDELRSWGRILGARGWLAYTWPAKHGGPGWTAIEKFLFELECAEAGAPRIPPFGPIMVAPIIMEFGTPEQRDRFLPPLARGETWWCQGYSEPNSGSDLASLKTTAKLEGDHYIVNGQKTWTTYAQYADWIFCLVRTRTEGKPQAGISFLLVDMKSPGITVKPIKLLDGECEVNEVFFNDVSVPVGNRIGEENRGWNYAKYLLSHERTTIADIHGSRRQLARLKRLAQAEGVYDDHRIRDEIAKLEVEVIALEMLVLRTLSAETSGRNPLDIAALLKIKGSDVRQAVTELMMRVSGPLAVPFVPAAFHNSQESQDQACFGGRPHNAPLGSAYFNLRKTSIYGGSNEVQRNIIAQTVLG